MNILSDNTIIKEFKPLCLNIISDLFINCKQEIFKKFNDIMNMMGGAIQACQMDYDKERDNIDFLNYIALLKETIIETLTCIFTAVKEIGKTDEFIPFVKGTVDFINITLRNQAELNNDIIKSSIGLIGDYCAVYGSQIKPLLDINLLKENIEKIKKDKEIMENTQMERFILWAQKSISDALINN